MPVTWMPATSNIEAVSMGELIANGGFELGDLFWHFKEGLSSRVISEDPFQGNYCLQVQHTWEKPFSIALTYDFVLPLFPSVYKVRFAYKSDFDVNFAFWGLTYRALGGLNPLQTVGLIPSYTLPQSSKWQVFELNALGEYIVDGCPTMLVWWIKDDKKLWLDEVHVEIDLSRHSYSLVKNEEFYFYLWRGTGNKCVIFMDGGPLYSSLYEISSAPFSHPVNFSESKYSFIQNLVSAGYNVVSPLRWSGTNIYGGQHCDDIPFLTLMFNWVISQGWIPYLFGFSAGGVITASEIIRKAYATNYGAAIIASGLMRYDAWWDFTKIANQIKTDTLIIAPVDDTLTYQGLVDFYNKAKESGYDVELVPWSNGHDPFPNLSLDGRTLTEVTLTWLSTH